MLNNDRLLPRRFDAVPDYLYTISRITDENVHLGLTFGGRVYVIPVCV